MLAVCLTEVSEPGEMRKIDRFGINIQSHLPEFLNWSL